MNDLDYIHGLSDAAAAATTTIVLVAFSIFLLPPPPSPTTSESDARAGAHSKTGSSGWKFSI